MRSEIFRSRLALLYFGWVVLFLVLIAVPVAASDDLLIRNVILVSPERDQLVHDIDVLVHDGYIREISENIESEPGFKVLDASGLYLTPGLIDSHIHAYQGTGLKRRYTKNFDTLYNAFLDQQPRSFLYFGYTSVIELNAKPKANQKFRAASHHPNLFHCSHGLVLDDGFFSLALKGEDFAKRFPHYLHVPGSSHPTPDGDDPANHTPARSVKSLIEKGASCIKLHYEEALWYPGGSPSFRLLSQALIEDIVRAAHAKNIPVVLHATTPSGHRMALRTGVDIVAHGLWEWPSVDYETNQPYKTKQPPESITALVDKQAIAGLQLQPTMRTIRNTQSMFDADFLNSPLLKHVLPAEYLDYLKGPGQVQRDIFLKTFGKMIVSNADPLVVGERLDTFTTRYERLIKRFSDKGGHLLLGTDTAVGGFGWGSPPGLSGYLEMRDWARAGISLQKIFRAATLNNAKAFGLEDQLGTIEPGKRADLLLLDENPLSDVSAYNSIKTIIIGGRPIDRQALSASRLTTQ